MLYSRLKNKKVLVMGLGFFGGGVGVTRFLTKQGACVTVTDLNPAKELAKPLKQLAHLRNITYHLGGHKEDDFKVSDLIVVNPSIPSDSPYLALAKKHHIPLTTEINLFFQLCPCRIVGITGSNGKTTTTVLLGEILKAGMDEKIWIGGNIGQGSLLEHLVTRGDPDASLPTRLRRDKISAQDIVVLELSSFQLENLGKIKKSPFMSVVLNIRPNHLDRHKTMKNYINAKKNIIRYQDRDLPRRRSYTILNMDDAEVRSWARNCSGKVIFFSCNLFSDRTPGAFIKNSRFYFSRDRLTPPRFVCRTSDTSLVGNFNYENILAAITAAGLLGVSPQIMSKVIKSFRGVEHRLEFVRKWKEVKYYNDSIATNPESTIAALSALGGINQVQTRLNKTRSKGKRRIILIAGGYDKQLPFDNVAKEIVQRTKAVVLLGATAFKIKQSLINNGMKDKNILLVSSFPEAVYLAKETARRGDTVLLSPACASYDMFHNFTERGNMFKELVKGLS